MQDFFNSEKDPNCLNIISLNLSHFNASLITVIYFIDALLISYLDVSNLNPTSIKLESLQRKKFLWELSRLYLNQNL